MRTIIKNPVRWLGYLVRFNWLNKILYKISASNLSHARSKESYTTVISIIVGNVKRFNTRTNYFIYPPRHSLSHSTASLRSIAEWTVSYERMKLNTRIMPANVQNHLKCDTEIRRDCSLGFLRRIFVGIFFSFFRRQDK